MGRGKRGDGTLGGKLLLISAWEALSLKKMGCAAVFCQLSESCDSRKVQAPQALLPQLTNFEQFLDEQPDEVQARGRIRAF